ncbi:Glycosyltransferase involved in cell wall bisynthesis [Maribacter sedimenticola]|uniref:Glycosyltransferase involved in cell wall bisynthesis n=1 Tax=Maribacter sedimenticola TaxID=228956 RepID=A0ABY1SKQ3_9FLAO|nr:glycosyltransferase [Maribacter sedimenticola]SNR66937.1 Glycosyltransferase involved in cell wall bisynthesis [Maribacter sedimenticola]
MGDNNERKKILWIHNFEKGTGKGGGWMFNQYEFLQEEVDIYYLKNLRNPISFLKHCLHLRKLSRNYDIVHAQYGSAVGFITSLLHGTKIISLKGSDWYTAPDPSFLDRGRIILGNKMTRFSLNRTQHVIVMSDLMRSQVLNKFPNIKVTTIVDPIDLDFFKPKPINNTNTIKKVLFAAVDINTPVKRFWLARQAFELLKERRPNTELIIMSKIPHNKVCDFMNGMDVLLLTSSHEGWPNVVKEMLACNKPFVSTKVSDLEIIAKKTISCSACDDNPETLALALEKALDAPNENLRQHTINFSMQQTMNTLKKVYKYYLS